MGFVESSTRKANNFNPESLSKHSICLIGNAAQFSLHFTLSFLIAQSIILTFIRMENLSFPDHLHVLEEYISLF